MNEPNPGETANAPPHVNVFEMVMMGSDQRSGAVIHKVDA